MIGPQYEALTWRGHSYDVRKLAASFEWIAMRARQEAVRASGRDASVGALFAMEIHEWVLAQARGIHEVAETVGETTFCTCALAVPAGMDLADATGHLDTSVWVPTKVFVVAIESGHMWEEPPTTARAICQQCAWRSEVTTPDEARQLGASHGLVEC